MQILSHYVRQPLALGASICAQALGGSSFKTEYRCVRRQNRDLKGAKGAKALSDMFTCKKSSGKSHRGWQDLVIEHLFDKNY